MQRPVQAHLSFSRISIAQQTCSSAPVPSMPTSSKLKTSERQAILLKVQTVLKKKYGRKPSNINRPVLESLLYAACLEDSSEELADAAYARLISAFHDLNEIRVSTISEIEHELASLTHAEWRALRIRDVLQTIFESQYRFDLEHLKRKTQEAAVKELNRFRHISPFMKLHVIQNSLESHVLALDETMLAALVWLGQVDPGTPIERAAEELKSTIRKSDSVVFCQLLRAWVNDPPFRQTFRLLKKETEQGIDPEATIARLEEVLSSGGKRLAQAPVAAKPAATKAQAAKTASAKAASAKPAVGKKSVKKPIVDAKKSTKRPVSPAKEAVKKTVKKSIKKTVATPKKKR